MVRVTILIERVGIWVRVPNPKNACPLNFPYSLIDPMTLQIRDAAQLPRLMILHVMIIMTFLMVGTVVLQKFWAIGTAMILLAKPRKEKLRFQVSRPYSYAKLYSGSNEYKRLIPEQQLRILLFINEYFHYSSVSDNGKSNKYR